MKNLRQPTRSCVNAGFSLIELMVSMAIGLLMVGAALTAYVSSSGASKMSEAQSRMNEDAQAALSILSQQIKMAGNNPYQPNYTNTLPSNPVYSSSGLSFAIQGCDSPFSNLSSESNPDNLLCGATGGLPNSIAISYEADPYNTIPSSSSSHVPTDCLGQGLTKITATVPTLTASAPATGSPAVSAASAPTATQPTVVNYYIADNRFYIATSLTVPSLYCKGSGNTTGQPLVENIEDLQFLYGTVITSDSAKPFRYLTATGVTESTTTTIDRSVKWKNVRTVRICVVVRSEAAFLVSDNASASYTQCDGTLNTAQTDRRLRRAYSTTVALRNRLL